MAMKFWFGKKDSAASEEGKVSCDVLTIPAPAREQKEPIAPLFGVSPADRDVIAPLDLEKADDFQQHTRDPHNEVTSDEAEKTHPASEAKPGETSQEDGPLAEKKMDQPSTLSVKVGAQSSPANGTAKTVLRPVAAPLRLVASGAVSGVEKNEKPSDPAVAAVAPGAVGDTAKPMAFGFRLKGKTAMISGAAAGGGAAAVSAVVKSPSGAQAGKTDEKAEEGSSLVRPKADQRALYYELMNGLYDAVLILDDQGHVVDSNTRVTAVLGYAREDMWDLPIDKVITGMTSQMFEHLRRNLAENHHVLIDARCFRQDGTAFAGEVGVSQLSLTRGGNMVFVIRNVDRRKTAMEELRKGQAAMQVALAPAFVCDLDGFFQIVNQALLESFGIPDEKQAKSVRFIDLLPDAARFFLRASCGEKLRETVPITTPDGGSVNVELVLSPIQNGQTVTAVAGSLLQQ